MALFHSHLRTLKLLNGTQPPPMLFLLWYIKMSAVKPRWWSYIYYECIHTRHTLSLASCFAALTFLFLEFKGTPGLSCWKWLILSTHCRLVSGPVCSLLSPDLKCLLSVLFFERLSLVSKSTTFTRLSLVSRGGLRILHALQESICGRQKKLCLSGGNVSQINHLSCA